MLKALSPYQSLSVQKANRRMNIWEGSVRSSKTTCADLAWIKFLIESDKNDPFLMVGRTERTLKRNIIDPMMGMLGARRCGYNAGIGEMRVCGRTVYTASANDERAVTKIAGLTLKGAYADELSLIPETFFRMLMSRLSLEGSRLYATSNPDSSQHWLLKKYLRKAAVHYRSTGREKTKADPLDLVRFSFRLGDNPYLPPKYIEDLAKEYTGLWKLRYIDGEWVIAEGAVYPMWGDHLLWPWQAGGGQIVIGIDYGTTNPFAAIACEIGSKQVHVFRELYIEEPLTDAELSQCLREWMSKEQINPDWICIDPSAASFKRQLHRDRVYNLIDADNSVLDGIRMVSSLMSSKLLKVDPLCVVLQEEIPDYRWDDKASEKGLDKPIKAGDHLSDALRYAIATTETQWRYMFDLAA